MINSLIIGVGGIIVMMIGWVVVQQFWGQTFAEYVSEEDVMAGRTKCSNCHCATVCENKKHKNQDAPDSDSVTIQEIETA